MSLAPFEPGGAPAVLLLGLVLGLRHALDPDHLAAVVATVARHPSRGRAIRIGAAWGLGHALSVLLAGGVLVLFSLRLPPWASPLLEAGIGVLLVALGVDLLRSLRRNRVHLHAHEHDGQAHLHLHRHDRGDAHDRAAHDHPHPRRRALLVGMAHGLAGSAGVAVLVAAATPSRMLGLVFLALFGLGATAAMAIATAVIGLPFAGQARLDQRPLGWLRAASALVSIAVGLSLALAGLG